MKTNRNRALLCGTILLSAVILPARALDLSVEPSVLNWDANAWVDLAISNITPGAEVKVALLIDVDQNHAFSAGDRPLLAFILQDGVTNPLGAAYMPADQDGLVNGAIQTRFSYHGLDAPWHTIGSYLWVALTNSAMPVAQGFAILQETSTVWITGTVRSYSPPHDPIPAARVQLVWFWDSLGFEPQIWTDTNGQFRLYLPSGVGTSDVRGVLATAAGYLSAIHGPDGEWLSAFPFEQPLVQGENALTNDLYLAEQVPDQVYAISGRVVMIEGGITSPVPFVLVHAELEQPGEEDLDLWSLDITQDDGSFRLLSPANFSATLFVGADVNMRGLVCELQQILIETQDVNDVEVRCYPARSLVRGRVLSADTGDPIVGLDIYAFDEEQQTYAFGYTMGDGHFEIGAIPGTSYLSGCFDDEMAWQLGYVPPAETDYYTVEDGEVYTNILFELDTARIIQGRVFNVQTNALSGGTVRAFSSNSWDFVAKSDVNLAGEYEMLVPAGQYRLQAEDFAGYLVSVWSNHFTWEWNNGPVYDPVVVSNADLAGIDFYLSPAAYIRGTVLGENVPLEGVEVRAMIGWSWRGNSFTDSNGFYEISVLGGTSYIVEAEVPGATFWLYQYYSNAYDWAGATPVYTVAGAPATNINFNLTKGGRVEGRLFNPNGITAFTNVAIVAGMDLSNTWVNANQSDPISGAFSVVLPPGQYRVRADAPGWLPQYYGGYFNYQWTLAPVVTVAAEQVVENLNITMAPPSYIVGVVKSGGAPLSNMPVEVVWMFDTNNLLWSWIQNTTTYGDGSYSLEVPPGSNFAVRVLPDGASGFVEQWWSNAPGPAAATLLVVGRDVTISNINFNLIGGMRILGRVTDGNTGEPVTNGLVQAWRVDNGSWWWAGESLTDTGGYYAITVPPTTGHVVTLRQPWDVPFELWWYPTVYYSNTYLAGEAKVLWTNAGASVSNVDFRAYPGFQITGRVVRAIGGAPVTNAQVDAMFNSPQIVLAAAAVDNMGDYGICMPTNGPTYARAQANGFGERWYSNTASAATALPIYGVAYTRIHVPFELAAYNEDLDDDGFDEYTEMVLTKTDPLNASDHLHMAQAERIGAGIQIQWMSKSDVNYWIERSEDLKSGVWSWVAGPVLGTGGLMRVTDTNAPANAAYKIVVPGM